MDEHKDHPLLKHFDRYSRASLSREFHDLAQEMVDRVPSSSELTVALRKLLEAKDAFVRAAVG